jgi:hypothetical protein
MPFNKLFFVVLYTKYLILHDLYLATLSLHLSVLKVLCLNITYLLTLYVVYFTPLIHICAVSVIGPRAVESAHEETLIITIIIIISCR